MKIDTSTTKGKIEVMQAWFDGKNVQYEGRLTGELFTLTPLSDGNEPVWSWGDTKYYIKPQSLKRRQQIATLVKEALKATSKRMNGERSLALNGKRR